MSGPGRAPERTVGSDDADPAPHAVAGSSASARSPPISFPPMPVGMEPDPTIVRADERRTPVATLARADRARRAYALRARARSAGGVRRAVALVGRQPRGVLGRDLGILRRRWLLRPRARQARDARRRVVPGRAPLVRAPHLP